MSIEKTMRRLFPTFLAATMACFVTACGEYDGKVVKRRGQPDVVSVEDEDAAMNAAIAKARETVGEFTTALRNPPRRAMGFSFKMVFEEGEHVEHIWVSDARFDGTQLHGTLGNEPLNITSVKLDDPVSALPAEVSDWMFVEDGALRGGYTIRALRDRLSPAERAEHDAQMPFRFE
jgi:uncharacterized protein YegJ (DUF2314 family)